MQKSLNTGRAEGEIHDALQSKLHHALEELEVLKRELKVNEAKSCDTDAQIKALAATDLGLRQKLTALSQREIEARYFAYHDALTGLPNRSLLLDRFRQATLLATRNKKQILVLLLDLDGFKEINDTLGHGVGDKLLVQVGRRLSAYIRGGDTACRYGGDEFVLMLPDINDLEDTERIQQKLHTALAKPYLIDANAVTVTASIGSAIYPADSRDYAALIECADAAMYTVKMHRRMPLLHGAWSGCDGQPFRD